MGRGGEATEAGPGALKGRRRNGGGRVWVPTSTTPRPRRLGPRLPPEPARCAIPGRRRRGPLRVFLRLLELRPRRPSPAAVDKSSPPRPGRRPISQSGRRGGASWGCARVLQPRPGRRPQPGRAQEEPAPLGFRPGPRPPAQMFSRGAFQAAFQGPSSGFAGRECAAQGAIATWQGLGSHWPGWGGPAGWADAVGQAPHGRTLFPPPSSLARGGSPPPVTAGETEAQRGCVTLSGSAIRL